MVVSVFYVTVGESMFMQHFIPLHQFALFCVATFHKIQKRPFKFQVRMQQIGTNGWLQFSFYSHQPGFYCKWYNKRSASCLLTVKLSSPQCHVYGPFSYFMFPERIIITTYFMSKWFTGQNKTVQINMSNKTSKEQVQQISTEQIMTQRQQEALDEPV